MDPIHIVIEVVHHGGRRGVALVGMLGGSFISLVLTQMVVNLANGGEMYYTKNTWPKSLGLAIPGLVCLVTGILLYPGPQKARAARPLPLEVRRELARFDVILKRYFDLFVLGWGALLLAVSVGALVADAL